jgi:hypothetical protein
MFDACFEQQNFMAFSQSEKLSLSLVFEGGVLCVKN